jgi:hypothetical protein
MGQLDDTARRLLREMGYQAEANPTPGAPLLPRKAAENLDLDPSLPEYQAALDHLVALGDIERQAPPDPLTDLPEEELYRLTGGGLKRVREICWWQ